MTIVVPTASSIKMRFPEFSDVDDAQVEFAIEEARLEVGDNWLASTVNVALAYLVAHYVFAARARGGNQESAIASESIGRLSVSYARGSETATAVDATDKDTTSYGRRYLEILEANFSGPIIV